MINEQRLPGYTGHIKGLHSENLYSQTYGETTAKAFTGRHPVGHDLSPKDKFQPQTSDTYRMKNFRRFSK